jgi:hypothetical protein
MKTIREEGIAGGLLWSLRCHRRDGGFMVHNEGGTPINSYHFPGFGVGQDNAETQLFDLLRTEAYRIRGLSVPPVKPPSPAPILFRTRGGFTWRGATGANYYTVERALSPDGPWEICATGVQDSVVGRAKDLEESNDASPVALWVDETSTSGSTYVYRVRGFNLAGASDYSPVFSAIQP